MHDDPALDAGSLGRRVWRALQPLADALEARLLRCQVQRADETPLAMLSPGKGKTHRAYLWAYPAATG